MTRRLEPYRQKRDFRVTPEPEPAPGRAPRAAPAGARFMVHKHDATRLHYDLRLELEGVLASWAIPRGPSYDPAQKRLAVQTEDHPLAYADFEGRIPEGEYGAGDSLIWDRGTWRTEPPGQEKAQLAKGHLALVLEGEKLRGLWHLVRTRRAGGKQQWLLFKARDERADAAYDVVAARPESVVTGRRVTRGPVSARQLRAPHPPPIDLLVRVWPPMHAIPSRPEALRRGRWSFELAYEGRRAVAGLSGGRVALQSRQGHDLAARLPEVVRALSRVVVGEAVLDGVVAAIGPGGTCRPGSAEGEGALAFVGFDLPWLEGQDLRERPLDERRELLESLFANHAPALLVAERVPGTFDEAMESAARRGCPGLVAKRVGSRYEPGESRDWRELRRRPALDAVVVGYLPGPSRAREKATLLVALCAGEALEYAGRVAAGLDSAASRGLLRLLESEQAAAPRATGAPRLRGVRWVEPRHVVQVEFEGWTEGRQLRGARLRRVRPDKAPADCLGPPPASRR